MPEKSSAGLQTSATISLEIYYAPTRQAKPVDLATRAHELVAAGVPSKLESEDADTVWIVFDAHRSDLLASVQGKRFVFGRLHYHTDDPPTLLEIIERVMASVGFSADEDSQY